MCGCSEPCMIPTWVAGVYGYLCANCGTFIPC